MTVEKFIPNQTTTLETPVKVLEAGRQQAGEIGLFAIIVEVEAGDAPQKGRFRLCRFDQPGNRHTEFGILSARVVARVADERKLGVNPDPGLCHRRHLVAKEFPL